MINTSHLARSVGKYVSALAGFSEYAVVVGKFENMGKKIIGENTVHVHMGPSEAFAANGQLGSSRWAHTVIIDLYIPQRRDEDYDDGPVGEAVQELGEALAGAQIDIYSYRGGEHKTGTSARPSAIKIDQDVGPAARLEVTFVL